MVWRQKVRDFLTEHHVNVDVPECGPPLPEDWPPAQCNDPGLLQAIEECRQGGKR